MRIALCRFAVLGLLVAGLALLPQAARALLDSAAYTEEEKVGFAFHKLGRVPVDFEEWIKETKEFQVGTPHERLDMLRSGLYRLEQGYGHYLPEDDLIFIGTKVRITRHAVAEDGRQPVSIAYVESPEYFFPVKVGELWVALVAPGLEDFREIVLDKEEGKHFVRLMGFGGESTVDAVVRLRLKPVLADVKEPIVLEDTPLWPMLMEIGHISLWDSAKTGSVWTYAAPWYVVADHNRSMAEEGAGPVIYFVDE